jgi:hypothetical protein
LHDETTVNGSSESWLAAEDLQSKDAGFGGQGGVPDMIGPIELLLICIADYQSRYGARYGNTCKAGQDPTRLCELSISFADCSDTSWKIMKALCVSTLIYMLLPPTRGLLKRGRKYSSSPKDYQAGMLSTPDVRSIVRNMQSRKLGTMLQYSKCAPAAGK